MYLPASTELFLLLASQDIPTRWHDLNISVAVALYFYSLIQKDESLKMSSENYMHFCFHHPILSVHYKKLKAEALIRADPWSHGGWRLEDGAQSDWESKREFLMALRRQGGSQKTASKREPMFWDASLFWKVTDSASLTPISIATQLPWATYFNGNYMGPKPCAWDFTSQSFLGHMALSKPPVQVSAPPSICSCAGLW